MASPQSEAAAPPRPLRLWPGIAIVALQWLGRFVVPRIVPEALYYGVMGGLVGGLAVAAWWVFLSRAPWLERLGAVVLMVVALLATRPFLHASIATGMMGMMFVIYAIPVLSLAFVAWAVASRRLAVGPRRASMVVTIVLACGGWTLVRTNGISGEADSDFDWRWAKTPEERLLAKAGEALPPRPKAPATVATPDDRLAAKAGDAPASLPSAPAATAAPAKRLVAQASGEPAGLTPAPAGAKTGADWPGFRGPGRDGIVRGVRIRTDWAASPPVELWRRPIGPGWSSFAVRGDFIYTQEQRGDEEIVACYKASTGDPVWMHRDAARFWESNAGAGPRGTPTLANGRVYSFGATGILNALDAGDGAVVWSRNPASDTDTKVPGWGFASSPLVVDDVVIVATAGTLVAYDAATGERRWLGPKGRSGYSSPQFLTIDGVAQVLLLGGRGATSVAPADGAVLWEHALPEGTRIVQPAQIEGGDLLVHDGEGSSMRRIAVAHGPAGWSVEERWASIGLKPYFSDFVVHHGHAYGFDGGILACIDVGDGKRTWKGGRYGHGQLVLLPDQDLLLVLSEEGELALVSASPDQFRELARVPAIEGKTWNHPVLAGNVLLVRNGQEMAAFRLAPAGG